jgi:hypothetical protein
MTCISFLNFSYLLYVCIWLWDIFLVENNFLDLLLTPSDNWCLLIEELILFTFRVMIVRYLLIPVFLLLFFSGWISCWLFFTFVTVHLFCWFTELIMLDIFPTLLGSPIYLLSFIISWPLMFVTLSSSSMCMSPLSDFYNVGFVDMNLLS